MEIEKEVRRRHDELTKIRDNAIAELVPLTAFLNALDGKEEKPKRTRRKKDGAIQTETK